MGLRALLQDPQQEGFSFIGYIHPPRSIWVLHNYGPYIMGERMHKIIIL